MKNIIYSLIKTASISGQSLDELTSYFIKHEFPKRHILIESGKTDRNYYFIEKGITRSYVLIGGKEVTHWFSKEGDVTFAMHCIYNNKPALEYVELLEPSILYSISFEELENLYRNNIELANWGRLLHQGTYQTMQLRHLSRLHDSARKRYEKLQKEQPDLFLRVNLGYIASYLGMTQVMLSNLRSDK